VYHAWLVEDVEGQRVRVLTQESQIGDIFAQWDKERPNKMCTLSHDSRVREGNANHV
jgi:hypothetical protein